MKEIRGFYTVAFAVLALVGAGLFGYDSLFLTDPKNLEARDGYLLAEIVFTCFGLAGVIVHSKRDPSFEDEP